MPGSWVLKLLLLTAPVSFGHANITVKEMEYDHVSKSRKARSLCQPFKDQNSSLPAVLHAQNAQWRWLS